MLAFQQTVWGHRRHLSNRGGPLPAQAIGVSKVYKVRVGGYNLRGLRGACSVRHSLSVQHTVGINTSHALSQLPAPAPAADGGRVGRVHMDAAQPAPQTEPGGAGAGQRHPHGRHPAQHCKCVCAACACALCVPLYACTASATGQHLVQHCQCVRTAHASASLGALRMRVRGSRTLGRARQHALLVGRDVVHAYLSCRPLPACTPPAPEA